MKVIVPMGELNEKHKQNAQDIIDAPLTRSQFPFLSSPDPLPYSCAVTIPKSFMNL